MWIDSGGAGTGPQKPGVLTWFHYRLPAGRGGDAVFQENINGNVMKGKPFVTADRRIWFQGTDNKLWCVFWDGEQWTQSNPRGNTTSASPFVTADGWVWFPGTDNGLYCMKTDGSSQFKRGGSATANDTPIVTGDGWVWFRGTDNVLYRMRTDGSDLSTPGENGKNIIKGTPFIDPDGLWVWFRGTDDALWRMTTDGSSQSKPGGNTTNDTPFVTADGWVWFRGTNNVLYRMRRDGSDKSAPGENGENSTMGMPFVTVDGWVWFQGTNKGLYRMFQDGTHQSQVDGQLTASSPVVGPMGIAGNPSTGGIAGEWVYFRGVNDDKLWRDFVPADAVGPPQTAQPAYYILTVVYAPPGTSPPPGAGDGESGSSVEYSTYSSTGTKTTTSRSFGETTEVGADFGKIGGDFSAKLTETDTSSLEITKGTGYSLKMYGPSHDGIDHDYDVFLLLINPTVTATPYPQGVVVWSMGVKSSTGTASIVAAYAGQLKGTMDWDSQTKKKLDNRGLKQSDYDQILSTNPFASGSGAIDLNRFLPTGQTVLYKPPPRAGDPPIAQGYTLTNENVTTTGHEVETEYSVSIDVNVEPFNASQTLAWTSTNSTEKTGTTKQEASAWVSGPSYGSNCPPNVSIYLDAVYNSFMFVFPTEDPSCVGTLLDESGQPVTYKLVTLTVGGSRFSTYTDDLGEYRFYGTPAGQGTITVDGPQIPIEVGGSEKLVTRIPGWR